MLEIVSDSFDAKPIEFAIPRRHSRKTFSVLGFPNNYDQGRSVWGTLNAADAHGLLQMDASGPLKISGGFSGTPVWSPDVDGFVGLVVTEQSAESVAWCIPSRILAGFCDDLLVRFRVPPTDRPRIHDYDNDDPNVTVFGKVSNNGQRRLTATVIDEGDDDDDDDDEQYLVTATYECLPGSPTPRGGYVTFITYPDFEAEDEDAYELFALVKNGKARTEFYADEPFTIAAIGDAGDTVLTFDLSKVKNKPRDFR